MTETFYIRVDITSDENLEFYEDRDDGDYVEIPCPEKTRKTFNRYVEKAVKKVLVDNIEVLQEDLNLDEGIGIEIQEAIEEVASKYYDAETDLTAVTEFMETDVKFRVVKR
jgi:hypothetical protein